MADFLFNQSYRSIVKTLNLPLPLPPVLKRLKSPWSVDDFSKLTFLTEVAGNQTDTISTMLGAHCANASEGGKVNALIYDGRAVRHPSELKSAHHFFHNSIKRLSSNGRVILIAKSQDSAGSPEAAAASRGLEGLMRSLAKEIGRKGSTANMLYSHEQETQDGDAHLLLPLLFFLSPRSAYISADAIECRSSKFSPPSLQIGSSLAGKIALVTGSARGIGAATAKRLSREGAKVIIHDIPAMQNAASALAAETGAEVLLQDIASKEAPKQIAEWIRNKFGKLDILVHNAGITRDRTIGKMEEKIWDQVLEVNLLSAMRLTDELLKGILADDCRITGLSSISGIAGNFGQTNYATSKAGMIAWLHALGNKLREKGAVANAVAPGFIETDMTANLPLTVKLGGRRLSNLNQGGYAEDVAEAICFLSMPGAFSVNGQVLRVCGGSMIGA